MKGIVKPNAHDHALRVHAKLAGSKTRCGIELEASQGRFGQRVCAIFEMELLSSIPLMGLTLSRSSGLMYRMS